MKAVRLDGPNNRWRIVGKDGEPIFECVFRAAVKTPAQALARYREIENEDAVIEGRALIRAREERRMARAGTE